MAKGTTDWSNVTTWERVVASIVATDVKIDLKATALHFGCTYDTLENRFRNIKKLAKQLKDEVESGQRGEVATPSRTKSTPATPRKNTPKKSALESVSTGRVTKKGKANTSPVKPESGSEVDAIGSPDLSHTITTPAADSMFSVEEEMDFDKFLES